MTGVTAILPMKGHSERVPGKNLRECAGRPLFHWVTESLLRADLVDTVVVDTDSDAIEEAVRTAFPIVRVHRRPQHLHGDLVAMHDVVAHVVAVTPGRIFLQTHATNPLLTPQTIDSALKTLGEDRSHDSLMSVTRLQSRFYFENGDPVNHDPAVLLRTQDVPPLLEENSNLYVASREVIERTGQRIGRHPLLFEMDPGEAIDIDTETDFEIAQRMLSERHG